jgi:acetyltransferase
VTSCNLDALLHPGSVAVIGASTSEEGLGRVVLSNIIAGGFSGEIFAVNPKPLEVAGATPARSVDALPFAPELAIIATPAATVPKIVDDLGRLGTRAAIVLSNGINKDNGLRDAMLAAAARHKLRIVGPNCLGALMPHAKLNMSFSRTNARPGHLAMISQSGAIVTAMLDTASSRDVGFSGVVSAGDMADADLADLVDLFAADPHTRAILLYIEGVTYPAKFMSAARAAACVKPVIAIKAGRAPDAAKATFSHTGAMAGSAAIYDAAFRRAGIVKVDSLTELFDAAETLCRSRPTSGDRVGIVTNGGGAGILAVDALAENRVTLAALSQRTIGALDEILPAGWSQANPVDIGGDARTDRYLEAIEIVRRDEGVDAVLVLNCPTALEKPGTIAAAIAARFAHHSEPGREKPLIGCWLGEANAEAARAVLNATDIPVFDDPQDAVRGFGYLVAAGRAHDMLTNASGHQASSKHDRKAAEMIINDARAAGRDRLDDEESRALLAAYGVPVVESRFAPNVPTVKKACVGLTPPYVLKIVSPDVTHKSDVGGVVLALADPAAAVAAARGVVRRLAREHPEVCLRGFTVESMIERPHARELIVGLNEDATFGPVLMVGAGGKAVELLGDRALELPPLTDDLARGMIARTAIAKRLRGYRDEPAVDIEAVVAVLNALSAIAVDFPDVIELDINPLLVDPLGAIALDARVRISPKPRLSRLVIKPIPMEWACETVTRDRTRLRIRPVQPEDEAALAEFFHHVSEDDRRFRFRSSVREVDHERLAAMTRIDPQRTMTFLAFDSDDKLLATGMLASESTGEKAEVAVSVREDCKGRGISWRLLEHIMRYAAAHSIKVVESRESANNSAALGLERDMGFSVESCDDDPGERLATKTIETRRVSSRH